MFTLYGGRGAGAVAVEAALTVLGEPYRLVEADPFGSASPAGDVGRTLSVRARWDVMSG